MNSYQRMIFGLLMVVAFAIACAGQYTEEQKKELSELDSVQEESVEGFVTVLQEVREHSVSGASLLELSFRGELSDTQSAELAVIVATLPEELQKRVGNAAYYVNNWSGAQARKNEIEKEAGGHPAWPWVVSAANLLLGMGLPTSGPRFLRKALARTAPFLEAIKLRNAAERQEYHKKAYAGPETPAA